VYEVRAFWEGAAVLQGTASELGLRYRLTRNLETFVFERVKAVAAISEGLRSDIVDRGIPAEKVFLIPNGIETDKASSPARPEILGTPEAPVLGYIGSLLPYEGLDLLLESLPRVLKRFPKMRVLIVGGGPEGDRLKALAQSLNVEASVEFAGPVKHEEVFQFYGTIDLLIYPRRSSRLTELVTPLKPLEAMAQGLPVLASDVGGHKELIDRNYTGFLFRAEDMNDLATRIIELLSDPSTLRLVGATARERVFQTRTWHDIAARYQDFYARAMD
jgi:PEP-CTERM/exosortase A-associated glycosyltransferase